MDHKAPTAAPAGLPSSATTKTAAKYQPTIGPVLVTGASTGIGRATVEYLARRGIRVFAGVRREEDAESFRAHPIDGLDPIFLDVTLAESVEAVAEFFEESLDSNGLGGLVNNAGIGVGGPCEFIELDDWRRQFEVNVWGAMATTRRLLPLLRRGAKGRIVNMGSQTGLFGVPFMAPYCASKHALEAVTAALRMELAPEGIDCSIIRPGNVRTPIWDKAETDTDRAFSELPAIAIDRYGHRMRAIAEVGISSGQRGADPDRVARAVWHALTARRPRTSYEVGWDAKVNCLLQTLLPRRLAEFLLQKSLGI